VSYRLLNGRFRKKTVRFGMFLQPISQ